MTDSDTVDIQIDPPHLVVELEIVTGAVMELEYDLVDILDVQADGEEVEVIDAHWHGIVLEGPDGETHHVDLREVPTEDDG